MAIILENRCKNWDIIMKKKATARLVQRGSISIFLDYFMMKRHHILKDEMMRSMDQPKQLEGT